jgi:hypothetical protein
VSVAIALIVGAVVIFAGERWYKPHGAPRVTAVDEMTWKDALKVGIAQCFSLIPGRRARARRSWAGWCSALAPGGDRVLVLPRRADHVRGERVPAGEVPRAPSRASDLGPFAMGSW